MPRRYIPHVKPEEDGLMTYAEIAKALGYNNPQSIRWIIRKAMRKLRKATQVHREEWRELYAPGPEKCESVAPSWKVSELPLDHFPLMPRPRK